MSYLPYAVAGWLFVVGLYGIVTSRNLIHQIVSLSVVQASTYVLLLAVGFRTTGAAPVFADIPTNRQAVDPIVQALSPPTWSSARWSPRCCSPSPCRSTSGRAPGSEQLGGRQM